MISLLMGIFNNVFEAVAFVFPEKRFPAFQVKCAPAFLMECIDHPGCLFKTHGIRIPAVYLAVTAVQVAFIMQYQSTYKRSILPEYPAIYNIPDPVKEWLHVK
jgi:hypothetical protein